MRTPAFRLILPVSVPPKPPQVPPLISWDIPHGTGGAPFSWGVLEWLWDRVVAPREDVDRDSLLLQAADPAVAARLAAWGGRHPALTVVLDDGPPPTAFDAMERLWDVALEPYPRDEGEREAMAAGIEAFVPLFCHVNPSPSEPSNPWPQACPHPPNEDFFL